jgi:hypothetical protein
MNIPTGSSPHLENLIDAYSAGIWSFPFTSTAELDALHAAIDREVAALSYSDSNRIRALHDAAMRMRGLYGERGSAPLDARPIPKYHP